jgi:CheY-like chemotaxis protein
MARPTSALIVDDEAHVRVFVRLLLAEAGITTTWEAGNGEEALELVREHRPALVLLDVNMPVLNGLETLDQLQAIEPDLPVVMLTSESAMQTVREAARLGATGYILKQSPRDDALKSLRETLDALDDEPQAGD